MYPTGYLFFCMGGSTRYEHATFEPNSFYEAHTNMVVGLKPSHAMNLMETKSRPIFQLKIMVSTKVWINKKAQMGVRIEWIRLD